MTREEAISEWTFRSNHIKKWLDEYGEEPSIRHYVELIDMAIEALSVANLKEEFESADAEQGWILCSERLPKTGDSVLVTYSDGEVGIIWSARPKAWATYIESNNLIYPIAWMPLPKPYKGGAK